MSGMAVSAWQVNLGRERRARARNCKVERILRRNYLAVAAIVLSFRILVRSSDAPRRSRQQLFEPAQELRRLMFVMAERAVPRYRRTFVAS